MNRLVPALFASSRNGLRRLRRTVDTLASVLARRGLPMPFALSLSLHALVFALLGSLSLRAIRPSDELALARTEHALRIDASPREERIDPPLESPAPRTPPEPITWDPPSYVPPSELEPVQIVELGELPEVKDVDPFPAAAQRAPEALAPPPTSGALPRKRRAPAANRDDGGGTPGVESGGAARGAGTIGAGGGPGSGVVGGSGSGGAGSGSGNARGSGAGSGEAGGAPPRPPIVESAAVEDAPSPKYPPRAVRLRLEGTVVLLALVKADGSVEASVTETSSGHEILDEAARDALLDWRFRPRLVDGQPRPFTARVPFQFSLPPPPPPRTQG